MSGSVPTVVVHGVGIQGARGLQGPAGAPGSQGAYVHEQSAPAATWIIPHNLGRLLHVTLFDTAGQVILTVVDQPPPYNTATLTFPTPAVGTAYLS